jgi:hypothetical protein
MLRVFFLLNKLSFITVSFVAPQIPVSTVSDEAGIEYRKFVIVTWTSGAANHLAIFLSFFYYCKPFMEVIILSIGIGKKLPKTTRILVFH